MNSIVYVLLTFAKISLVVNNVCARSTGINDTPDKVELTLRVQRSSSQWSINTEAPVITGDHARYRNNPFLTKSHNVTNTPEIQNFTIRVESPFSSNATIIIAKDPPLINIENSSLPAQQTAFRNADSSNLSRSAAQCEKYHKSLRISQDAMNDVLALMGMDTSAFTPEEIARLRCISIDKLIIGGNNASTESYPHVVALGRQDNNESFSLLCGGSLITDKWILSAAHCSHGPQGGANIAKFGADRLSWTNAVTIPLKRSIRHPTYRPPAMYADIALMELETAVQFSDNIRPACLHQVFNSVPETAWVCGWGATEFGGGTSDSLQETQLDIVDNVQCAIKHNRSIAVPDGVVPSMICAGAPREEWSRDACYGDSGSPLQFIGSPFPCLYQIIGITSFSTGCAFVDTPGVYTRVSHYLDWIEDIVWPEK